jgi:hypothetical protein
MDGYFNEINEKKNSTNGTWIYANEDYEIKEGMTFKANHNLFRCKFV